MDKIEAMKVALPHHHLPVILLRPQGDCTPRLLMIGSGFFLRLSGHESGDSDIVVTAHHVVRPDQHGLIEDAVDLATDFIQLGSATPGHRQDFSEGSVLWSDHIFDVAILRVLNGPVAKFSHEKVMTCAEPAMISKARPAVGDPVFVFGHQGSMSSHDHQRGETDSSLILKFGHLVGATTYRLTVEVPILGDPEKDDLKGVSGSALYDANGEVIGVVYSVLRGMIELDSRMVLAVPITAIQREIDECQMAIGSERH